MARKKTHKKTASQKDKKKVPDKEYSITLFLETLNASQIARINKTFVPEPKPVFSGEALDISDPFWDLLKLSFKVAILKKKSELSEGSYITVRAIEAKMDKLYETTISSTESKYTDVIALATCYCNMALAYKDYKTKKKLSHGQSHLKKCFELLKGKESDRQAILIFMRATLQLDSLLCKLEQPAEKSYLFLNAAINSYIKYTQYEDTFANPFTVYLISLDIEDEKNVNSKVLLVMLYSNMFTKVYHMFNVDPRNKHGFAAVMHNLIKIKATEIMALPLQDQLTWALPLVDLARYFGLNFYLTEMRSYLALAQYITDKYQKEVLMLTNDAKSLTCNSVCDDNIFNNIYGYLVQTWGVYGNTLLFLSKYKLLYDDTKTSKNKKVQKFESLTFTGSEESVQCITNQITDTCVTTHDDAKKVFVFALKWFNIAEKYDLKHISIKQTIFHNFSMLYKSLAYFELDKTKQQKLHTKQLDILEKMCKDKEKSSNTVQQEYINRFNNLHLANAHASVLASILDSIEINKQILELVPEIYNIQSNIFNYHTKFLSFKLSLSEPMNDDIL